MSTKTKAIREPESNAAFGVPELDGALRERIAARAYDLYLERGGSEGHEVEDWLEAERQIVGPGHAAPG